MKDLPKIRQLIANRMMELGGGYLPISAAEAAKQIQISKPALHYLMHGKKGEDVNLSVETSLKLANWLRQPREVILRLAGHESIAELLKGRTPAPSPHAREIANMVDGLPAQQQSALAAYIRDMLREE